MFSQIQSHEIQTHVWQEKSKIRFENVHPENLKYRISANGEPIFPVRRSDFTQTDRDRLEKLCIRLVHNSPYLQICLCELWFYLSNFQLSFTRHLICSALCLSEENIQALCSLFDSVIFDEAYPIFNKDEKITGTVQSIQVTGLSDAGKKIAQAFIQQNCLFYCLYGNGIVNDVNQTAFYTVCPESSTELGFDQTVYTKMIEQLFANPYFQACGHLNVSSLSMDELKHHALCIEIQKRVEHLYLLTYDLEVQGNPIFVKYLQWY